MRLQELAQVLDLEELTPRAMRRRARREGDADITRGYASDLLSDVLANAPAGGVLVTLQVHLNVIAVASHAGLRAVIFSCGRMPRRRRHREGGRGRPVALRRRPPTRSTSSAASTSWASEGAPREARAERKDTMLERRAGSHGRRASDRIRADLHIHTALSPCASDEMTPPAIVAAALARGLDMIAVSDHNTAGNVGAVQEAAEAAGGSLTVLAGMEITCVEEVHVLGLFPDLAAAESVAARIRASAPGRRRRLLRVLRRAAAAGRRRPSGGRRDRRLATATPLDLTETVELIHSVGGLAIAAHVDRKSFSVFSQLGFFPEDAGFDGVEVSRHLRPDSPRLEEFAALGLPVTSSSDSHFLEEIGTAATELRLDGAHLRRTRSARSRGSRAIGRSVDPCMTSPSICSRCSRTRSGPEPSGSTSAWSSTGAPTSCG